MYKDGKMDKKLFSIKKIILSVIVLVVAVAAVYGLSRPAVGSLDLNSIMPKIGSSPLYVMMEDGQTLSREYVPSTDMEVNNLELLLVNTDAPDGAYLLAEIKDENGDVLATQSLYMDEVPAGEWIAPGMGAHLYAGQTYYLEFTPVNCNPYFMQVDGYDLDVSVGFDVVSNRVVTYGDIFYYSTSIIILIAAVLIMLILFGAKRVKQAIKSLNIPGVAGKCGNEVFLILLFMALALKIYSTAYIQGVYITADSDGYLREAVNLYAGKGFSYDGLAGYNTWFANWPIVYPALIALLMKITGAGAYLASKYVAVLIVALIEAVLYVAFGKKAWIYALTLTNLGFLGLAYHTWSEVPFILFLLLFGLALGKIVEADKVKTKWYVLLGFSGVFVFLTRYFGIYVWFVAGLYGLMILIEWLKGHKELGKKIIGLIITAVVSGVVSLSYLVLNKIKNGNPTGVSRGTWWDDYQTLTDDLVKSLVTEIFNVFRLDVPSAVSSLPVFLQVWLVIAICVIVTVIINACLNRISTKTGEDALVNILNRYMNLECVMVLMGIIYYAMFIVIRYRSSMDTFYFRFFEPATFLITIGVTGLIIKAGYFEGAAAKKAVSVFAAFVSVMVVASIVNSAGIISTEADDDFYTITTNSWDQVYDYIPQNSVVIWSDLDYRSTWYRPDVVGGELFMDDTIESLSERYYGSKYLCIREDYAISIALDGEYDESIEALVDTALKQQRGSRYVSIKLN